MNSITRLTKHSLTRVTALGLGLVAWGAVAAAPALAGTATSSFLVSATVPNNCVIAALPLAFGTYDPIITNATTPRDVDGGVLIVCTLGSSLTLTLGQGANPAAGSTDAVPLRRMSAGGSLLPYFLYQEASRTTVWGNTPGSGIASTGTGGLQGFFIYGRIPAGQLVPAGSYTDTVVATVNF